jgi:anthranilate/para-aminobenzoate synthase component I
VSFCSPRLAPGAVELQTRHFGAPLKESNMTAEAYKEAVLQAKEHIKAGDIFQIVLSQRFERRTFADPFEVYRALRVVNPSPYMTYLQVYDCETHTNTSFEKVVVHIFHPLMIMSFLNRLGDAFWLLQVQRFLRV